ncbi:glycoside hydrolase [Mycena latifolia]|nr:glycoside hydrolase [Mycena latifolia]
MRPYSTATGIFAALLCLSLQSRSAFAYHRHRGRRFARDHRSRSAPANTVEPRGDAKYVFMHHIIGNTYEYNQSDWEADIKQIHANGVDAIALNIGSDSWEVDQVASAYAAAKAAGSSYKLFLSFDFTSWPCDVAATVAQANRYAYHPNQFMVDGKPMVSSYEGSCLSVDQWAQVKDGTGGYLMPFVPGQEGNFDSWPSWDSWLAWGAAWSQDSEPKTTADDEYYLGQLHDRYATTVSGGFFTHYDSKNRILNTDDWLLPTRWEQLFGLRDNLTFVEMITWSASFCFLLLHRELTAAFRNDFGESDYYGPVKGSQPSGTTWTTGYDHTPWFDMSKYYISGTAPSKSYKAFKTGTFPAIDNDTIYYWARPHPAAATASSDALPRPDNTDWTTDYLWATVFATGPASVTLRAGRSSQTFDVAAGVTKLKIPLTPGNIGVALVREGKMVINHTDGGYAYVESPELYNYNFYVGSASA